MTAEQFLGRLSRTCDAETAIRALSAARELCAGQLHGEEAVTLVDRCVSRRCVARCESSRSSRTPAALFQRARGHVHL